MNLEVFSIHDSKAEAFQTPIFSPTIATALRMFETACNDNTSDFHRWARDYALFHIGTFNSLTGMVTHLDPPVNLGLAVQFVTQTPNIEAVT